MLNLYGQDFTSRLLLGTANYPSLACLLDSITQAESDIITLSLRRQMNANTNDNQFWSSIKALNKTLLPNTAGCREAKDAVMTAQMAREIFETNWIKLEVIGDDYTLQPDPFQLVAAAETLIKKGFQVFPYCSDDLMVCQRLVDVGCEVLMPLASPIGSGRGIANPYNLQILRERFNKTTLIVDAGLGKPSQAAFALELGYDAVLLNTAVADAIDPVLMAQAFRDAVSAGRMAYHAGCIKERLSAKPSTPLVDTPFWQQA